MTLSPYLRSSVHPLRLTHVVTHYPVGPDTALVIGAKLAWAAQLAEFERVEVCGVDPRTRHIAYVIFGEDEKVEWWCSGESGLRVGAILRVDAFAWRDPHTPGEHVTQLIGVGKRNAPIEIRRVAARPVPADPHFFPTPQRRSVAARGAEPVVV